MHLTYQWNLPHTPHDALHFSITNLFVVQNLGTNLAHFVLVSSQGSKKIEIDI